MKTIEEIDHIIDLYLQGYDLSDISIKLKTSERTVRKYVKDFNQTINILTDDIDSRQRYDVLRKLTEGPSYNSENRKSRVYDSGDLEMLKELAGHGYKNLKSLHNEAKKKGLNVSYSTFRRMLKALETK